MASNIQDLRDAIAAIGAAVEADVKQDEKVMEAIEALIAKIEASGTTDFSAEIAALSAESAKLSGDNEAVQAVIDKAVPPTA